MSIHQTSSSHTPASLWFLGCLLATQLAAAAPAWSQIAAHASTATTSPEAQLKSLREELSALEGRVHELENSIRMYGGNNTEDSDVLLLAGELSLLQLKSSEADRQTILGSGKDDRYGLFLSRGDIGSAALTSTDTGSGRLEIANSKGDIVAQGGAKPNGIGIFLTGPSCCSPPGALGPHQYILGRQ